MKEVMVVVVALVVDVEGAQKAGYTREAEQFLAQFKGQGDDWRREVESDPLLRCFLTVHVRENGF